MSVAGLCVVFIPGWVNHGSHYFINSKRGDSHPTHNSDSKPSQAKVLTGGGDLREAQVDVPLSVSHSCV